MSMDIVAVNTEWGSMHFHYREWAMLWDLFSELGCPTDGVTSCNDGDLIPEYVCQGVANKLEENLDRFMSEDKPYIEEMIPFWRNCGGARQW